MHRIAVKELQPGMRVLLSDGSERELTSVGEYTSFGMPMFGWRWIPGTRKDGGMDCGYSGVSVETAGRHFVRIAPEPAATQA